MINDNYDNKILKINANIKFMIEFKIWGQRLCLMQAWDVRGMLFETLSAEKGASLDFDETGTPLN